MTTHAGLLVLVVGPSGSGKDTVIGAVREAFAHEPALVFPRREITRPAEAGGEDHVPVEAETFRSRRADGAYALAWEAHGLCYGVPAAIRGDLAGGCTVVVNVSRGVIDVARRTLAPVRVVSLAVPPEVLRLRLTARGRETIDDVERRVQRAGAFQVTGPDVVTVVNDGPLEAAVARMVEAIGLGCTARRLVGPGAAPAQGRDSPG